MAGLLWVAAGGGVGAVLRYLLHQWIGATAAGFPLGTLVVNALGCFAIGLAGAGLSTAAGHATELRLLVVVGLLGGFTTFSTFGWETVALLREDRVGLALLNVVLALVVVMTNVNKR